MLIILRNDSVDSNRSAKFTVLVVVAFTKKKKEKYKDSKQTKHNLLQHPPNTFFFGKCFQKKITEYFLKFLFSFEITINASG